MHASQLLDARHSICYQLMQIEMDNTQQKQHSLVCIKLISFFFFRILIGLMIDFNRFRCIASISVCAVTGEMLVFGKQINIAAIT